MKIGMFGLGIMGFPIATNLVQKCGCPVAAYDPAESSCVRFRKIGGATAAAPETIYQSCDVIFSCLPNNDLVRAHLESAVKLCRRGTVVVDLSSSLPSVIQGCAKAADLAGVALVDCPVSGGHIGAVAGNLSAMCGGRAEDIEKMLPLAKCFAAKVTHMGSLGCGYTAKLANNMIIGSEIAVIAEAFSFAEKAGLDPRVLFEAIRSGGAASAVLDMKVPKMLDGDYSVSSSLAVHLKDQHNALLVAGEIKAQAPLCTLTTELMDRMREKGRDKEDVAAVIDLFR
jgi:3-hydroxyisobutyrate dehydrogenase and related beta-hydroxyacid dehydrogenases